MRVEHLGALLEIGVHSPLTGRSYTGNSDASIGTDAFINHKINLRTQGTLWQVGRVCGIADRHISYFEQARVNPMEG